eukprot:TRINITY_DN1975_c0_g4_i1.p1 TRINITY_DN1975_c0_g4~~TRINITY_DN1975_c0_g4_i1.p1  ORF type:complete len:1047 (+),score=424.53 TRINITY_DN1975_c0_g4_i1:90-3230(+)
MGGSRADTSGCEASPSASRQTPCVPADTAHAAPGSWAERYAVAMQKLRWVVLVLWVLVAGGMAVPATSFMGKTSQTFDALPGTQSLQAQDAMVLHFPEQGLSTNVIIYFKSLNHSDGADPRMLVSRPGLAKFDAILKQQLEEAFGPIPGLVSQYESYWTLAAMGLEAQALSNLVSHDGESCFIAVSINALSTDKRSTNVAKRMQSILDEHGALVADSNAQGTPLGLPSFMDTIVSSAEQNLGTIDAISIPLAMCVLAYVLRSWRLLVLPLVNMGATAAVSFGVMSLVADHMNVNSVAPSLMMSILVAMSIDYSLFLLSRYRDEIRRRMPRATDPEPSTLAGVPRWRIECVEKMVGKSGETISVSALTLGVCFLALLIFPMNFIQSIGLANAITISIALLSNMTITPAALLAFHGFFEKSASPLRCPPWADRPDSDSDSSSSSDSGDDVESPADVPSPEVRPAPTGAALMYDVPRFSNIGAGRHLQRSATPSEGSARTFRSIVTGKAVKKPKGGLPLLWWRLAELTLPPRKEDGRRFPWNWVLILVIVGLTVPFDMYAFNNAHTDAMDLFLPRGASVTAAYNDMSERFGLGKIYPITLLVVLDDDAKYPGVEDAAGNYQDNGPSVMNDEFYGALREKLVETIPGRIPFVGLDDIISPVYGGGRSVNWTNVAQCQLLSDMLWEGWSPTGVNCQVGPAGSDYPYHSLIFNDNNNSAFGPAVPKCKPALPASDPESCVQVERGTCYQCQALINMNKTFTSVDGKAMYMFLNPRTDPLGVYGENVHDALMDMRSEWEAALGCKVFYSGYNAITWDTVQKLFDVFPIMIAVEGAVVFLILGTVFKSIMIPLRAVCTIGLTLAWTFGFCDLVYEHNKLGWVGITAWNGEGAVEWTNTIVLFSMIVGIGLDYDIFLLTRVKEYHDHGVPTRDAIRQGLCDTGRIITAAGIIMAVAFSGLFVSDIAVLNQMGFYLVFSVLFETFVVESVLSPALMGLLGDLNWFPQGLCSKVRGERQPLLSYHPAHGGEEDTDSDGAEPSSDESPCPPAPASPAE